MASAPTQALHGHWVISGFAHLSCASSPLGGSETGACVCKQLPSRDQRERSREPGLPQNRQNR